MSKIKKIGADQLDAILEAQRLRDAESKAAPASNAADDSVVSSIKPEITNAGDALKVAVGMIVGAKKAPEQAISAQSGLDEARVRALLDLDQE